MSAAKWLGHNHARLLAVGRAEAARFALPFSQEVMADVLGLSVPHVNRMMQRLRAEKLIADRARVIEFIDVAALQALARYQRRRWRRYRCRRELSAGRFLLAPAADLS